MVYRYHEGGFIDEAASSFTKAQIVLLIAEHWNDIELDFGNDGHSCLQFYYYYIYPVMLRKFIKTGSFSWLNPAIHKYINSTYPTEIVTAVANRLKNQWGQHNLVDDIDKNGMFFPFIGNTKDSIWFGKHRWLALSLSNYNKDFLTIHIDDTKHETVFAPVLDFEDEVYYKMTFSKLPLDIANQTLIQSLDFLGNHHHLFGDTIPFDFIDNKSNFQEFLFAKGKWQWLKKFDF